jgi:serine phosphatase RsbU (regulator of sigma subunit)
MVESAAEDWPARVQRLENEVSGLRRAMRTRGLIEQAKGVLTERLQCDPETAFASLSRRSQETNTPLVDVAADIVNSIAPLDGPVTPPPAAPVEPPVDTSSVSLRGRPSRRAVSVIAGLAPSVKVTWPVETSRLLRRAIAALDAAEDLTALTGAVLSGLSEMAAAGAAIFAVEPNGAVRLIGCEGWTAQQISDARRIPALIATPMSEVVRHAHPILLDGFAEHDLALIGPGPALVGYPIVSGSRVIGVLLISWAQARSFSGLDRHYLDRLAKATGRALGRLWSVAVAQTSAELSGDLGWIHRVIEGTFGMTQLLVPVRDEAGAVVDFIIEAMSPPAIKDNPEALGRRLLDAYPQLLENGVFDAYVRTLADGVPWERAAQPEEARVAGVWRRVIKVRRAAPIGGAVIASWDRLDEFSRLEQQVSRMELLGRFGWCEWDPVAKRMWWSPGLYQLLGRDPRRGPLSRTALVELAEPEHRPAFAQALRRAAHGGHSTVDIDIRRDEHLRHLRVFAEGDASHLVPGEEEVRHTVRLVIQDISDQQHLDEQLRRTQAQASAQRVRLAAEHELTRELMQLVYPARSFDQTSHGLHVVGRHYATDLAAPLRGDFCDAQKLPNDDLLIVVGDMFGAGMTAASAVARLLPPVPVLGIAGLAPEGILTVLNAELHRTPDPPLASLALARVDHVTKVMTWAQAGHLPPILIRKGVATALKPPEGPALGLVADATYTCASAQLEPDDIIVFYTDGVLDRRARDPLRNLSNRLGRTVIANEPESALELPTPARTDEACLVALSYQEPA